MQTVAAINMVYMIREGSRITSGTVATLSGAALVPLQNDPKSGPNLIHGYDLFSFKSL